MTDTIAPDKLAGALAELTISDEEICRVMGVSLPTVRRWSQRGLIPPKKGAGRKRGRPRELTAKMLAGLK